MDLVCVATRVPVLRAHLEKCCVPVPGWSGSSPVPISVFKKMVSGVRCLLWQQLSYSHKQLLESLSCFLLSHSRVSASLTLLLVPAEYIQQRHQIWALQRSGPRSKAFQLSRRLGSVIHVTPPLLFQLLADLYHRARTPLFFFLLFSPSRVLAASEQLVFVRRGQIWLKQTARVSRGFC